MAAEGQGENKENKERGEFRGNLDRRDPLGLGGPRERWEFKELLEHRDLLDQRVGAWSTPGGGIAHAQV